MLRSAVQRRASAAFDSQVLGHADTLYNLARYLTGRASDAEDLVQETFLRALRSQSQFSDGSNLRAWLCRILRNAFIDQYRRGHTETSIDEEQLPIDSGGELEQAQLRAVTASELEAALMTLPVDSRAIILLDLEGFSEAEIASIQGCAAGTVKSRLFRARAALRARVVGEVK